MMKELMMNEDFSDVTLVTEDKKEIKANINVLNACSPFFKDILKKGSNTSAMVYLRGIQYSAMESIMQFIYFGETTFYEESMEEFFKVAKSLKIKELCDAETNVKPEYETPHLNQNTDSESMEENTVVTDNKEMQEIKNEITNNMYECEQCHKKYNDRRNLSRHRRSVHDGVKYACDQCGYQARFQGDLFRHIQSQHEGVKYVCDQCDYQAAQKCNLSEHIKRKH